MADSDDASVNERGVDDRAADELDGGDPACWANRVCQECGRLNEAERPVVCEACGATFDTFD